VLALDTVDSLIECYGGRAVLTGELTAPPDRPLPGELDGLRWRLESVDPLTDLQRILAAGFEFHNLHMASRNLETVFLNLTGRGLRE